MIDTNMHLYPNAHTRTRRPTLEMTVPPLDLKKIRERISDSSSTKQGSSTKPVSQQDLSAMLSARDIIISQTQISRYEDNPEGVPINILSAWLECLGTTLAQEWTIAQKSAASVPVNPSAPLQKLHDRLQMLHDYAVTAPDTLSAQELEQDDVGLKRLDRLCQQLKRKPNLVMTGLYDAGKTTLTNWLLAHGTELPEDYSPTTRIVTYVHHIEDRPSWVKERVWLMKDGW